MKKFRDYQPDQLYLIPPSLQDWLPDGHLAYFISDVVKVLDLSKLYRRYKNPKGKPPYNPTMMTALWLYAYCTGLRSSRKLEKATYENVGFRFLSGDQHPDHWTLNEFRRRHSRDLGNLFVQTVQLAQKAGMIKLGQVAIDGTRIKANASKHKAMSYKRMSEEERRLRQEIDDYFKEADEVNAEEDARYGKRRGDELPEELQFADTRLRAIIKAKQALEEEAREKARAEQEKRREEADEEGREYHPRKSADDASPGPKSQKNFTDPESRIMRGPDKGFIQGYNGQLAVDADSQIIVAAELTNQSADAPHLPKLVDQAIDNTGSVPDEVSADAGYWSASNLNCLTELGIETYIPSRRIHHTQWRKMRPPRGRIPKDLSPADRMMRKLMTIKGRRRYALRQMSVEPVFGQIKGARGLRQFLLRGLERVKDDWLLDCAAHNVLKLFRAGISL